MKNAITDPVQKSVILAYRRRVCTSDMNCGTCAEQVFACHHFNLEKLFFLVSFIIIIYFLVFFKQT